MLEKTQLRVVGNPYNLKNLILELEKMLTHDDDLFDIEVTDDGYFDHEKDIWIPYLQYIIVKAKK